MDTIATKTDVDDLIRKAESFNVKVYDLLERITNDKITKFRKELKSIVE